MNVIAEFRVETSAEAHLGAAGSVAFRLVCGVPLEFKLPLGRNVPALCVKTTDSWRVWFVSGNADEVCVRFDGKLCAVDFAAARDEPLSLKRAEFKTWNGVVRWLRAQLGLDAAPRIRNKFRRAFLFDIHDPRGGVVQSFPQVRRCVEQMAAGGHVDKAIVYLPGWDGAYDGTYPDYQASLAAGGWRELERLHETVTQAGGLILLHLNYWGLSEVKLGDYPSLQNVRMKNADGSYMKWGGATWCGATNPLYYVKADSRQWLEIMKGRIDAIADHGVRGVFLDQFGAPISPFDSRRVQMARTYAKAICSGRHDMIFGGELPMPECVGEFRLAQMWGPPWSGMPENRLLRVSNLCADVYEGHVQLFGHLGTPAPYPTRYSWTNHVFIAEHGYEQAFKKAWSAHQKAHVLPTLRLDAARTKENKRIVDDLFHNGIARGQEGRTKSAKRPIV